MSSYWNKRYMKNWGSTGLDDDKEQMFFKFVKAQMRGWNLHHVLDYGCGDLRMLKEIGFAPMKYTGVDISDVIIAQNFVDHVEDDDMEFLTVKEFHRKPRLKYDSMLLFNVLFHVMKDRDYMNIIRTAIDNVNDHLFIITWTKEPDSYDKSYQRYREWKLTHQVLEEWFELIKQVNYDGHNSFMIYRRKKE